MEKSVDCRPRIRRRRFLSAAAFGAAGVAQAEPPLGKKVRSLIAEGIITPDAAIGRGPLLLPPELIAALEAGFQVRGRVEYPHMRNLLVFYAFLARPTDPAPPLDSLSPADQRIFTHIEVEIVDDLIAALPTPSFGMYGRVVSEPKPSPFFPGITGLVASVEGGFSAEGHTTFPMLAVSCAGDHAVFARPAQGRIELQP